jgi:hypothetical protein
MKQINVGLIGDFDKKMYTHVALNEAIEHCRAYFNFQINAVLMEHYFSHHWIQHLKNLMRLC